MTSCLTITLFEKNCRECLWSKIQLFQGAQTNQEKMGWNEDRGLPALD